MKLSIQNKSKQDIFNIQWWQIFNILSVDVVIGALAGGVMAVRLLHVNPGFAWWIVMPLSVWIIYTVDHLIDGVKLKKNSHTVRHYFHYYYAKRILVAITILGVINFFLILFYLDERIIHFGLYAGTGTLVYIFAVYQWGGKKSHLLQKELFVALIYTVGIWGGPAALRNYELNTSGIILTVAFFLTVWIATLVLSVYEVDYDKLDKHNTISVNFGVRKTGFLIYFLTSLAFLTAIFEIITTDDLLMVMAFKIVLIMVMLLILILNFPEKIKRNNIYRILVELVFWLPGLFLLI